MVHLHGIRIGTPIKYAAPERIAAHAWCRRCYWYDWIFVAKAKSMEHVASDQAGLMSDAHKQAFIWVHYQVHGRARHDAHLKS